MSELDSKGNILLFFRFDEGQFIVIGMQGVAKGA